MVAIAIVIISITTITMAITRTLMAIKIIMMTITAKMMRVLKIVKERKLNLFTDLSRRTSKNIIASSRTGKDLPAQ